MEVDDDPNANISDRASTHGIGRYRKSIGKKQSELVREAVDRLIEQESRHRRETVLRETAGIWKERTDLPDFRTLRSEWERGSRRMPWAFLPDTDVLADFSRGAPQAVAFVKAHSSRMILSFVVIAELYAGVKGNTEQTV
jgi:hypothetical protein